MATDVAIQQLIDDAAEACGSLRKLATELEMNASNLVEMKQGKRPANWRVRGKLRVILGQEPAHAFVAAMAEDLSASENADEKKAADGFKAMLAAFPSDWRKRMLSQASEVLGLVMQIRQAMLRMICCRGRLILD